MSRHRWPAPELAAAVAELRERLDAVELRLALPEVERERHRRQALLARVDDHIAPRLERLDAPLVAVVGGSTGAGKSTLVNSLAGRRVSAASVLRPTTHRPVLLYHPEDEVWFADRRILPGLSRVNAEASGADQTAEAAAASTSRHRYEPAVGEPPGEYLGTGPVTEIELHAVPELPRGMAVIDAPDIDSVVADNRRLADELLAAADLWVFVTTAGRYADAVAWDVLRRAASRRMVVAVVLARVPAGAAVELRADLAGRLAREGLARAPLFVISEQAEDARGLLPAQDVEHVHSWLRALAEDDFASAAVVRQTLAGALAELVDGSRALAAAAEDQVIAATDLAEAVDGAVEGAASRIAEQVADGHLLRAEVLQRWQDVLGTGQWTRGIEASVGRIRDALNARLRSRPAPAEQAVASVADSLEDAIVAIVGHAEQRLRRAWLAHPAGRGLVADGLPGAVFGEVPQEGRDALREEARRELRQWQRDLLDLVRGEGQDRRTRARMVSAGINVSGIAAMLVVFSLSGGLTGAEVGIAGGTAVLGQKALEAIFGDQAVRTMARRAQEDLVARVTSVASGHVAPYRAALDHVVDAVEVAGLTEAISAVDGLGRP